MIEILPAIRRLSFIAVRLRRSLRLALRREIEASTL
jgi:hypothetical protein